MVYDKESKWMFTHLATCINETVYEWSNIGKKNGGQTATGAHQHKKFKNLRKTRKKS